MADNVFFKRLVTVITWVFMINDPFLITCLIMFILISIVGHYNVEILTLPRIYMKANVKQDKTSVLTIKSPGNLIYQFSIELSAQLFVVDSKDDLNWVCNFNPNNHKLSSVKVRLKLSLLSIRFRWG